MDVIRAEESGNQADTSSSAAAGSEGFAKAVVIEPSSSASSSSSTAGAEGSGASPSGPPRDSRGVIGLQLMMVSTAYALAGHYDEELLDLIGDQVWGGGVWLEDP